MKYKAIIFDIDGTISKHLSSWRYIHEKLGLWDELAYKYQEKFLLRKISYRKFCELDAAHWKGLSEEKVARIFRRAPYSKGARRYIGKLKEKGFKLIAISTGLQYMAQRIKKELEFDYVLANRLLSKKGLYTGGVKINITHGAKGRILKRVLHKFHLKPGQVIGIGDSAGDIPFLKNSGYSIAFNSSDKKLSSVVDYNCTTKDFKDIYAKIVLISGESEL